MIPQIHFNIHETEKWPWDNLPELQDCMRTLRKKVKEASGYVWDNEHFFIDGIYGQPVLTIGFYHDAVYCWLAGGTTCLPKAKTYKELVKIHRYAEDGYLHCSECESWYWADNFKRYSFAGVVCKTCYDPKRHLPPDTR